MFNKSITIFAMLMFLCVLVFGEDEESDLKYSGDPMKDGVVKHVSYSFNGTKKTIEETTIFIWSKAKETVSEKMESEPFSFTLVYEILPEQGYKLVSDLYNDEEAQTKNKYTYNENQLLIKEERVKIDSKTGVKTEWKTEYTYNKHGQKLKKTTSINNNPLDVANYTYKQDGKYEVVTINSHNRNTISRIKKDSNGQELYRKDTITYRLPDFSVTFKLRSTFQHNRKSFYLFIVTNITINANAYWYYKQTCCNDQYDKNGTGSIFFSV